jgi:hypothetical protein
MVFSLASDHFAKAKEKLDSNKQMLFQVFSFKMD